MTVITATHDRLIVTARALPNIPPRIDTVNSQIKATRGTKKQPGAFVASVPHRVAVMREGPCAGSSLTATLATHNRQSSHG